MPDRLPRSWLLLACLPACGGTPEGEPFVLSETHGLTFRADLEIPSFPADPALDVVTSWEGAAVDLLGLPSAPVGQVQLTGFRDLGQAEVRDALAEGTLGQAEVRITFLCAPEGKACAFSEFAVFGHDFEVSDYFGDGGGAWLLTRWGAGRSGVQGLEFLEPDPGSGAATVACGVPAARLGLADVAPAEEPLEVPAGEDIAFDWSALPEDAQGRPLAARRVDAATLLHLASGSVASVLEDQGFTGAEATRVDLVDLDAVRLSDLGRPEGIDDEGAWLLALWTSSAWVPAPVFLGVLVPVD